MSYNYSAKSNEHMARAAGVMLPISTKQAIEICNVLRKKNLQDAKLILEQVISMKKPIPYRRFCEGAGHKHGIGPGKYPVNASKEILELLKVVEANAQNKALNTKSLVITHIKADRGPQTWHYGRQTRIAMKKTHIEIIVEEKEIKSKPKKEEKQKKALPKKQEKALPEKKEINKVNVENESKKQEKNKINAEKKSESKKENKPKEEAKPDAKSSDEKNKEAGKK